MKISVTGWGRDMGKKELARHFLPTVKYSETATVYRDTPILYRDAGGISVAWFQPLRLTGNYRVEVHLSIHDIKRLFRVMTGGVLNSSLLEEEGFTMSPEFLKAALKTVKLSDLTLGDLAAMTGGSSVEDVVEGDKPANVKPFPRRA